MNKEPQEREYQRRQLQIDLPDLTHSDLVDIVRVLQVITDAFVSRHQQALRLQCLHEQQLELFNSENSDNAPF